MNTEQILQLANVYAAHRGLTLSTVATYATNDGKTFARLEGGGSCTLRSAAKTYRWFSDHWPLGLDWPSDIPRPKAPRGKAAAQDAA